MTDRGVYHPAPFSDVLLPYLAEALLGYKRVLDPMAGSGKLRQVRPDAVLLELEPEWASMSGAQIGDVLCLPWGDGEFDAVCTSPTYANRLADNFEPKDASRRTTYRIALKRPLSASNSGRLQWGEEYQTFHVYAWTEVYRVLRPGGRFVLNISNHIRKGKEVDVTGWHELACGVIGFEAVSKIPVVTPRLRFGQNNNTRAETEFVLVFTKPWAKPFASVG